MKKMMEIGFRTGMNETTVVQISMKMRKGPMPEKRAAMAAPMGKTKSTSGVTVTT